MGGTSSWPFHNGSSIDHRTKYDNVPPSEGDSSCACNTAHAGRRTLMYSRKGLSGLQPGLYRQLIAAANESCSGNETAITSSPIALVIHQPWANIVLECFKLVNVRRQANGMAPSRGTMTVSTATTRAFPRLASFRDIHEASAGRLAKRKAAGNGSPLRKTTSRTPPMPRAKTAAANKQWRTRKAAARREQRMPFKSNAGTIAVRDVNRHRPSYGVGKTFELISIDLRYHRTYLQSGSQRLDDADTKRIRLLAGL